MKIFVFVPVFFASIGEIFGQGLTTPILLYPETNGFNNTAAYFEWSSSGDATSYQFQISRDSTLFLDIAVDSVVVDTNFFDNVYEPDGWYHWRVRALNSSDSSNWSGGRRFFLKFPVSVEGEIKPKKLFVESVYPNPVSDTATMVYHAPVMGSLSIAVFDLLGKKIDQINSQASAGRNLVIWRTKHYPSGIYAIRVTVGNERTKTIILKSL